MQIGQVIRKYRKEKNMTQEEMARRLGVTAPAVNKWENGNSMPDITLLAPIARLLGISLDTLLTFQGDLTDTEVNELINTLSGKLKEEEFGQVFCWARKQMEQYPDCERLHLYMAVVLNGECIAKRIEDEQCEKYFLEVNERLLNSNEESVRTTAADALYGFYIRKELYDKAEEYLEYFSKQNPERKRKQGVLYFQAGRTEEAYRTYEELLYSEFTMLYMTFHSIFAMRIKEQEWEKAEYLMDRMSQLVQAFEMGQYYEVSAKMDLVVAKKDVGETLTWARQMFESYGKFGSWRDTPLYEHMTFRDLSDEFSTKMEKMLIELFRDGEQFGYMAGNEEWERLLESEVLVHRIQRQRKTRTNRRKKRL